MADKLQNTSNIDTVISSRAGLVTDLNSSFLSKETYSHARNAVRNSREGDLGAIGNEPSTLECIKFPFPFVGSVSLPDDTILIFSGDGTNSEIGLGNIKDCSYTTLLNLSCLGFDPNFPITGVSKRDFQKGDIVTFTDKNKGIRRIELKNLSKVTSCEDILLFKKLTLPCIEMNKGQVGNVPNGVYSAVIAYVVNGTVFTDWFSITNRIQLFSETGANSLEIKIEDLDTEFDQFALGIVGNYIHPTTKGATKLAKIVGIFSTKIKSISVTDFINPNYQEIKLSELVVKKNTWQKAGIISANSSYLLIADLVGRDEENYQLKAMSIESEYVIEQVPGNYYEQDGEDVSYYGDENYDYYIQGVYNTGEFTDKFHIPGRKATSSDRAGVSSADVYEYDEDFEGCEDPGKIEKWQVENTAGEMIPYNQEFKCDRRVLGRGKMGYFESTELYPDNVDMYGEWANTPIRYHKFPDECKVPRFSVINGKTYVNIKGVRFKKIPKFDNPDIVGYKITRSDRKGGNGTVVARGLMTNIRWHVDSQLNQTVMYSNYTVNDLSPDQYISETQTRYRNGKEELFNPLTNYYQDKFSFYSPHTMFEPRYTLGNEIKIESEEVATVTGQFERVYKHPKLKLLNQFSFWVAMAIGSIETFFEAQGLKTRLTTSTSGNITGTAQIVSPTAPGSIVFGVGPASTVGTSSSSITTGGGSALSITGQAFMDSLNAILGAITSGNITGLAQHIKLIKDVLKLITSLGATAALSLLSTMRYASEILQIIYDFAGYVDYVYQYNAHAKFDRSICVKTGNKRRRLLKNAIYVPSDAITIDDKVYNNYLREKTVYLELNKAISDPTTTDNSRNTMSGFGICKDPDKKTTSTGSAFYATSKVANPNQYGSVGSSSPVSMHSCVLPFEGETTTSPILYGGDCIITRFQFQKKMQFFNQNMANANFPDGTEYDYRLYRNIGYPRFWLDSTQYDFSSIITRDVVNFTRFSRTTTSKHNLDCKGVEDRKNPTRIDNAYMYLSNNSVMDFFVEADYNINFREKTKNPFYSKDNSNLSQIFRSDRLSEPEEFNINRVYSDIYTTEIFAQQQRDDFDPLDPIPVAQPNSVIFSLASFNLQQVDNWQYFLPANYFSFRESDFGTLTGIHKLDQDRVIFLFSKSSPYVSIGRDFLQLEQSGRKITVGDGGLFAQDPREVMPTDNNYGACNSRYAFSNTHLGKFYPSERQGRIINFTENTLDDITRQGVSYWCKNYMPIQLYSYFPTYPQVENPLTGVGYMSAFDSFNETIYISKRDFTPKREYINDITYNTDDNKFYYKSTNIALNSTYFDDNSWTLSYSPLEKAFISWHDWHPDWVIQTDDHFMTVKGTSIWKHNERFDSFCNFYEKDYPFEVEYVSSSGQQVEIVRNIEYMLEVYKYKNFGRDRFHVHHQNFDRLVVHNTEQISPLLNLVYGSPNPEENLDFPRRNNTNAISYDVPFFKEENKYKVNMFWDSVKDRGEFTNTEVHLFPTDGSGYKNVVNPVAIDINKPEEQRKKFRHYWNKFRLTKTVSGPNKFITKIMNIKKLVSIR